MTSVSEVIALKLLQNCALVKVIPYVKVFARVAPEQKELIMTTFKSLGRITLMCGDGTNDVGALKQAHAGVALLNEIPPPNTSSITNNRHLPPAELQRQKLKKMMDELNNGDASIVKPGDTSVASPFTAKLASVSPTTAIIRQGRSTLVTTLQMFKILGLNGHASAYLLSVMHLDGVKLGDFQATISAVCTSTFFLFISQPRPLSTLSAQRPHANIFCLYVFLSLLCQFSLHLLFLISSVKEAKKHMPEECIEPASEFESNLVNTVSYIVNLMIQLSTFAVNYVGHPFNQSISENKPFKFALLGAVMFFTVITSDMFRELNEWLQLVPLPRGLREKLLIWGALMFFGCYTWERSMRWAFPGKMLTITKSKSLDASKKKSR